MVPTTLRAAAADRGGSRDWLPIVEHVLEDPEVYLNVQ
jgi:hypothetical protein